MPDQTTNSISISAAPADIMDVIADLEAYPAWTPGVKTVEVLEVYEDDRPATARFAVDQSGIKDTYTLAYEWDGDESVSWTIHEKGSITTQVDGSYTLTDNGDGSTDVGYTLTVDISIPMLGMMKRKAEKVIVETALKGLKARVEG